MSDTTPSFGELCDDACDDLDARAAAARNPRAEAILDLALDELLRAVGELTAARAIAELGVVDLAAHVAVKAEIIAAGAVATLQQISPKPPFLSSLAAEIDRFAQHHASDLDDLNQAHPSRRRH